MSDSRIYSVILAAVKDQLLAELLERTGEQKEYTDVELLRCIFKNFRINNNRYYGLRLSYLGSQLLQSHYKSYKFKQEKEQRPPNKVLVVLDKNMIWPYYVSKSVTIFFSEHDATWFQLNGANLNEYIECM